MIRAAALGFGTVCLCATFLPALAADATSQELLGNWARQDGETRVKIAPCGGDICATNTWVRDPDGRERLGDVLVLALTPKSPTVLAGRAHDERRDMNYSMQVSFGPSGMQTRGCILLGILCRTAAWSRIQ